LASPGLFLMPRGAAASCGQGRSLRAHPSYAANQTTC